jgi:hypothetical protein
VVGRWRRLSLSLDSDGRIGKKWERSATEPSRWGRRGRFEIVRIFGGTHREALPEVGLGLPLVWCPTPVQPSLFIVRRPMTYS